MENQKDSFYYLILIGYHLFVYLIVNLIE